ncbi:hypothetical protein, partial [Bacillus cereus]|uniref:hypothetical protein n=1 Tax=Bacillus cereus TaxID=1396 RepID=UPI00254A923A
SAGAGVLGNIGYAALTTLGQKFKTKFKDYFGSEKNAEEFFNKISSEKAINVKKPKRDIEDIYEEIVGEVDDSKFTQFTSELQKWLLDNKDMFNESTGETFNIGNQVAQGDINNASGIQIVNNTEFSILHLNKYFLYLSNDKINIFSHYNP